MKAEMWQNKFGEGQFKFEGIGAGDFNLQSSSVIDLRSANDRQGGPHATNSSGTDMLDIWMRKRQSAE